jgi:hypothetical protein
MKAFLLSAIKGLSEFFGQVCDAMVGIITGEHDRYGE